MISRINEKYEAVIGLEVHAQLLTESKLFCGCSTKFGSEPNSNVCPVCTGQPGVMPVLNKKAVEYSILMGAATNSVISKNSVFARKNYFYPDLPKGYQISQYDKPFCENGYLEINTGDKSRRKKIRIKRIHLEEDAGKSIHDQAADTLLDFNRSGVPLLEIVTEPDIRSAGEAYIYLTEIKKIVRYLGICSGNMEEGSLRCDANVSLRIKGSDEYGTKTELKNMNSFRNVERAVNYEIERQYNILEDGEKVKTETLLWNAEKNEAVVMRSKEESHDYRYFPEPDLLPVVTPADVINEIVSRMPELPAEKFQRFTDSFNLPDYDADVLTQDAALAEYFEKAAGTAGDHKITANWVMTDVLKYLNENKININQFPLPAEHLGELVHLILNETISGKIAKEVFPLMIEENKKASVLIRERKLIQMSDASEIEIIIDKVFQMHKKEIEEYLSGKEKVFGFLVGKVMKESEGKANPAVVNSLLKTRLNKLKL